MFFNKQRKQTDKWSKIKKNKTRPERSIVFWKIKLIVMTRTKFSEAVTVTIWNYPSWSKLGSPPDGHPNWNLNHPKLTQIGITMLNQIGITPFQVSYPSLPNTGSPHVTLINQSWPKLGLPQLGDPSWPKLGSPKLTKIGITPSWST